MLSLRLPKEEQNCGASASQMAGTPSRSPTALQHVQIKTAIKGLRHPTIYKQTTTVRMTTTTYTNITITNTNANEDARLVHASENARLLVGAAVEDADLCTPYITLEGARKEKEEAARKEETV
jgi:hypothetical protein